MNISLILAFLMAVTTILQPPNTMPIGSTPTTVCQEPACVITSVSIPTAQLWFGTAATWCSTPVTLTKLPITVNDATGINPALCPTDPAPGSSKHIVAQQGAVAYTIGYSINNVAQTPVTIAALAPPPPTVVRSFTCTGSSVSLTYYSDSSFTLTGNGTCK